MTVPVPVQDLVLAARRRRAFARLTDGLLFAVPLFVFVIPFLEVEEDGRLPTVPWLVVLLLQAAVVVYEVAMIATRGQTIGKTTMSIRVVRADTGEVPTWSAAGIRALLPAALALIPVVGLFLYLAVFLWAFVDPRRRGLHDRAAGTLVVTAP